MSVHPHGNIVGQSSTLLGGIDTLEQTFAQVVDRLTDLEQRLEPLLPQMPESMPGDRPTDPRAPAGRALQQVYRVTDGLVETRARLERLLNRLDV